MFPIDILSLQHEKGYALQDILTRLHTQIFAISKISLSLSLSAFFWSVFITTVIVLYFTVDFPKNIKIEILEKLAEIEIQLSGGGSEKVQLAAFVGVFQCARDANQS